MPHLRKIANTVALLLGEVIAVNIEASQIEEATEIGALFGGATVGAALWSINCFYENKNNICEELTALTLSAAAQAFILQQGLSSPDWAVAITWVSQLAFQNYLIRRQHIPPGPPPRQPTIIEKKFKKLIKLNPNLEDYEFENHLICPISLKLMLDPVQIVESKQTYDRRFIEKWLSTSNKEPLTGVRLSSKAIVDNKIIRDEILDCLKNLKNLSINTRSIVEFP